MGRSKNAIVYFSTKQVGAMKTITDTIRELLVDDNLMFTSKGMLLNAMDPSHCALVQLNLDQATINDSGTGEYYCSQECRVGINFPLLNKVIKTGSNEDQISLEITADKPDKLVVRTVGPDGQEHSEAEISLLDLDAESISIPDMEYDAVIQMSPEKFKQNMHSLDLVDSDTFTLSVCRDAIKFSIESDSNCIKLNRLLHLHTDLEMTFKNNVDLKLSRRYMNIFSKPALGSQVSIFATNDMPITVSYDINGLGTLRLFLSPRICDADDDMENED